MIATLYEIIRWSELWALLIPLTILRMYRTSHPELKPIILYLWIALPLNFLSLTISEFSQYIPSFLKNNNIFYNVHSVIRVILFGTYITRTGLLKSRKFFRFVLPVYFLLALIYFWFRKSPLDFSFEIYCIESVTLLGLCISYFLLSIKDESDTIWMDDTSFLLCTGISFYESITFFVFLFFDALWRINKSFGETTMMIFSGAYAILCIIIAIALSRSKQRTIQKTIATH